MMPRVIISQQDCFVIALSVGLSVACSIAAKRYGLTNTRVAQASFGVLRHTPLQWSPIDLCRLRCAATTTMTGMSTLLVLSLHDLRGLPPRRLRSTVPCSMIFGSVS